MSSAEPARSPFAPGPPARLAGRQMLLIIVFGLLVLIPGILPSSALLSDHETLAAQPAREMLRDGRWIIQHFAGVPRYEKPPATSWLIAASIAVFRTDAEWAVRVPSVIAAIAASLIVAAMAARWLGGFAGTLAGLIQLTTVWLQTQATLAEADIQLVLWISAAIALFALGNVPHPSGMRNTRLVRCAFAASLGLLFLFKGPIPLLFAVLAILLYIIVRRQWTCWHFFADPLAIAVFIALLVAWPIAAFLSDPAVLPVWKQELFGYTDAQIFGAKSRLLYLYNVPAMLLPWCPLLIVTAITTIRRHWWNRPFAVLLLAWFIPGMCILQWASYKSPHYSFPLLPPFSIAMAAGLVLWVHLMQQREIISRRVTAALILLATVAGIIAIRLKPSLPQPLSLVIGLVGIGLLITIYLEHRKHIVASLASLFATIAIAIVVADVTLVGRFKAEPSRKDLAVRTNQKLGNQKLYLLDFDTDSLVWYLSVPLERHDDLSAFTTTPLPPEGIYAMTRGRSLEKLAKTYRVETLDTLAVTKLSDTKGESKVPFLVHLSALPATAR